MLGAIPPIINGNNNLINILDLQLAIWIPICVSMLKMQKLVNVEPVGFGA